MKNRMRETERSLLSLFLPLQRPLPLVSHFLAFPIK
jgi:hypothetical protein